MRFTMGHRILDVMQPRPRAVGMRAYLMARWRRKQGVLDWSAWYINRIGHKPRTEHQRGWMPGKWRIDGMQAPRRVINPAVRYWPVTRICNEIRRRRRKQGAWPPPYLWAKRIRKVIDA